MTNECNTCGRKDNPDFNGGWCQTCFSVWYDGGPEYTDPEKVKIVSLAQSKPTYSPKYPKRWEGHTPIWEEIPEFEIFSDAITWSE